MEHVDSFRAAQRVRVRFITASFVPTSFLRTSGLAIASAGLAGCTSSMNTDRFREQTMPVYRNPALESRWTGPPGGIFEGPVGEGPIGLPPQDAYYAEIYAAREDGGFLIPEVPFRQIDPRFYRQEVGDPFGEAPGTIVVDTADRYLYLVQPGGRAMRYGVGLGREGFAWSGRGLIQWKQKWPKWTPPNEMIARQPVLAKYSLIMAACRRGSTIRSARARSTSSRTARTRCIASTGRPNGNRSARRFLPVASAWSIRT